MQGSDRPLPSSPSKWPTPRNPAPLLAQFRSAIRVWHYSIPTEQAYCDWIKRLIVVLHKRQPASLGADDVAAFLRHLAVHDHVAAATQDQAKSALLFQGRRHHAARGDRASASRPDAVRVRPARARPRRRARRSLAAECTCAEVPGRRAGPRVAIRLSGGQPLGRSAQRGRPAPSRQRHPHGAAVARPRRLANDDIDAHVLHRGGRGVSSPLDSLAATSRADP